MSEVIVIGSGFGGSIAAKRFAEAGHRVTVLELGEDWSDPTKAKQSQDPAFLFRLLRDYPGDHLRTHPAVTVTQGMGVGGGSLVYSGIHLRAPAQAFAGWPAGYTRAELDPYYARVEQRLGVAALSNAMEFDRVKVFAEGARRAGLPPPAALPLAIQPSCTRCGWCVPICSFGKKTTMAQSYLADAQRTGRLTILAHRKAAYVARVDRRYRVWAWRTDGVARDYHRVTTGALEARDADVVVVACGAIESPALLARSTTADLPAGARRLELPTQHLGTGLDGTGDFVQGGFVPRRVDGFKGAVMMSGIELGDYVLEDLHSIPVAAAVTLGARAPNLTKDWGAAYKTSFRDLGRQLLAIAIVGTQRTERTIAVTDDRGNAKVTGTAYHPAPGSIEAARSIIEALGGEPARTPWETGKQAFTVHPTGGCAMGEGPDAVVRARDLQVQHNPGLYVIDGSVLPGNPMRNPSHTIAAVAERALEAILSA
jgi:choline dehydrogenase-like flavoprotein